MKILTSLDASKLIPTSKIVEYETGVYYYYSEELNGVYLLSAIVHKINGDSIVDAESNIAALIPAATITTDEPHALHDTYVRAYGKTALHVGIQVIDNKYCGHDVIRSTASKTTWEQIRKREYQIVGTVIDLKATISRDILVQ